MGESLSSRISEGLNVSLIGMSITISSLIILSLVIYLLSKCVALTQKKRPADSGRETGLPPSGGSGQQNAAAVLSGQVDPAVAEIASQQDNISGADPRDPGPELIAVFTAAIMCMTGAGAPAFRVTSFRRTGRNSPVWNARGRDEYISGKL